MKGLEYAKKLAREFRAKLILLHSIALQYYVASDEYARYDLPLLLDQIDEAAKQQMRDLVQQTNWNGVEVETSIEIGHAGQQIARKRVTAKETSSRSPPMAERDLNTFFWEAPLST